MRKNTFKITKGRMEEQINRKIEINCQAIKLSKEIMKIKKIIVEDRDTWRA